MKINLFLIMAAAAWGTLFVFATSPAINFTGDGSRVGAFILSVILTLGAALWEAWMSEDENWRNKKQ